MSKREIFENLIKMDGFKVLSILSNLSNYLSFLECNYKEFYEYYQQIQSWDQRDVEFYQIYLDVSRYLLNYSTTAKALAEKSMGWRNHLKNHLSCDLRNEYDKKLTEYDVCSHSDYFKELRDRFLHKLEREATREYYINFKYTRKEKASVQILSKEVKEDLIPKITKYYHAQSQFTKWLIQEIKEQFAKELREIQSIIKNSALKIPFHPDLKV